VKISAAPLVAIQAKIEKVLCASVGRCGNGDVDASNRVGRKTAACVAPPNGLGPKHDFRF
jgi:hypothetical protein